MNGPTRFLLLAAALLAAAATGMARAQEEGDPPARVGRISLTTGTVLMRDDYYGESRAGIVNWPVTSGNTLSTLSGARVEVRIGSTAIRLDGDTEVEFAVVDDQQVRLRLLRGTLAARVRDPGQARQLEVYTPEGRVELQQAGAYRFETGQAPEATAVTVFQGAADFFGDGLHLAIRPGQRAEIVGSRSPDYVIAAQEWDDFDSWCVARDRRDDASRSARYVPPEMTGYEDLDEYGEWQESADYGPVWYPRAVPAGWAPYRWGHWAWVGPWGWTWIDDAPWGFAPFHYGRWVFIGGFWAWTPGPYGVRPVYAPALVAWVGQPGWSISFSFGRAHAVGWYPLGPREVYVPGYRCSPRYVHRVNAPHVREPRHVDEARRDFHRVRHVNRQHPGAVTIAPSDAVVRGERVARFMPGPDRGRSIGTLPAVAPAPDLAPPKRHPRAAERPGRGPVMEVAPVTPRARQETGASGRVRPDADKDRRRGEPRHGTAGRDDEPGTTRRQAQSESAAPLLGESRTIIVPARPQASPTREREEGARGPIGRDRREALPQPRATQRSPLILGNPAGAQPEPRRRQAAPPASYDRVPVPRRGVVSREHIPSVPVAEPARREARGAAVRESRESGRGARSAQRESGPGTKARPNRER